MAKLRSQKPRDVNHEFKRLLLNIFDIELSIQTPFVTFITLLGR